MMRQVFFIFFPCMFLHLIIFLDSVQIFRTQDDDLNVYFFAIEFGMEVVQFIDVKP